MGKWKGTTTPEMYRLNVLMFQWRAYWQINSCLAKERERERAKRTNKIIQRQTKWLPVFKAVHIYTFFYGTKQCNTHIYEYISVFLQQFFEFYLTLRFLHKTVKMPKTKVNDQKSSEQQQQQQKKKRTIHRVECVHVKLLVECDRRRNFVHQLNLNIWKRSSVRMQHQHWKKKKLRTI